MDMMFHYQFLDSHNSLGRVLNFVSFNKMWIQLTGQKGVRQPPEEQLQQARDHIHIIPTCILNK
jgi:hypothetical protein